VTQAQRTGSLADETGAGTVPTPNTAGIEANSGEPLNVYVLLNATPIANGAAEEARAERTSYALQGLESELATHRGHHVQIVGRLSPLPPAAETSKAAVSTPQRIAVASIKMISVRCPDAPPQSPAEKGR
jgi:hypothetical protein